MTFAEADAQYELIKQRYQAGALTDEQYEDQLRELMVLDDKGRWWAKSCENGVWHYYDTARGSWMLDAPPVNMPATPPPNRPAAQSSAQGTANPTAAAPSAAPPAAVGNTARRASQSGLPKWAAVAPPAAEPAAQQPTKTNDIGASASEGGPAKPADKGAAGGHSTLDISPMPELSGSLKVVFDVLSLLVPVLGFVLFMAYRRKPATADRSAARVFLILGVVSLVFLCLFTVGIFLLEALLLGTGS